MPYYTKDDNEVDDFKDYDPTPYSGGYDISVTYGRSLPPSDHTCYPLSSRAGDAFEYKRPVFSSTHQSYEDQALKTEYSSYGRPGGNSGGAHVAGEYGGSGHDGHKVIDDDEKGKGKSHKEHSGKDSYDEKKEKKKDKKKDGKNSGDYDEKKDHKDGDYDEKKKKKDHKHGDDNEKKKKKDHKDGEYDEKKKKKDDRDGDYDDKKKKKDHKDGDYDDKKKKDHYKSNKDNYGSDDDKKKKKDHYKHHD